MKLQLVARWMRAVAVLGTVAALAGCANLNTQSRDFSSVRVDVKTVDASQRALYAVQKKSEDKKEWTAFCAEPSPDALVAYATSVGANVSVPGRSLELALAQQQSAASIGLRTQTIQLLRDGMYRMCEAYASGALDDDDMHFLMRRYQNLTIGLLAIEQITGPVIAQQVALSGSAQAGMGKAVAEITASLAEAAGANAAADTVAGDAKEAAKKATDALAAATKADAAKSTDETKAAVKDAQAAADKASAALKKANEKKAATAAVYGSLDESLKAAQGLLVSATGTAAALGTPAASVGAQGSTNFKVMADAVVLIVNKVVEEGRFSDLCSGVFSPTPPRDKRQIDRQLNLLDVCAALLLPGELQANARQSLTETRRQQLQNARPQAQ